MKTVSEVLRESAGLIESAGLAKRVRYNDDPEKAEEFGIGYCAHGAIAMVVGGDPLYGSLYGESSRNSLYEKSWIAVRDYLKKIGDPHVVDVGIGFWSNAHSKETVVSTLREVAREQEQ